MLEQDPALKAEFMKLKDDNPDFAGSQWAQLNWLFSRTEYWDERKNRYPVGRVVDAEVLQYLMSNAH
jgi:hypothetical protein